MLKDVSYTNAALTTPLYCKAESAQTGEHDRIWHTLLKSDGEGTENSSAARGEKWNKVTICPLFFSVTGLSKSPCVFCSGYALFTSIVWS